MADDPQRARVEELIALFDRHGVDFVLIGGQAEVLYGGERVTYDVDVCPRWTAENLRRLAEALSEIHPRMRGLRAGDEVALRLDAALLSGSEIWTLSTDLGDLDLLRVVEPLGEYEAVLPGSMRIDLDGVPLVVIGLDDLIASKRAIGRPKDLEAVRSLEVIRRLRDGGQA